MKLVKTEDNSFTFFNEHYNELYHSRTGAMEEAQKKYIEPLGLKDNQVILDICFGLGYNTLAAIEKAKHLKITALEKDQNILNELQRLNINKKYNIIKEVAKNHYYKDENYEIILILGPAEKTIKQIKEQFDIVFLDPFAPRNNPELWTQEFFQDIYKVMKQGAKLATYSCARMVRDNLKAAGFIVTNGPHVGRRGPSTNATKPLTSWPWK
jgi:tRNA U34 5-methylaminomethyl-2-thiouridine-forming methyltransferase MnmC